MAIPNRSPLNILEKMERGRIQGLSKFLGTSIISGTGKATDFKFDDYIYRANTIKAHKNLEQRERGRIQWLPNFLGYPVLSQERVKLRTSNFLETFIRWIGTKALEKFWE